MPIASDARAFDVVVLGAGAAGLMCAAVAVQRGRSVALLDHNAQPGRKILISGGGRCNFTNIHCAPDRFLSENPHFAKSALALYEARHFLELVDRYRIPWHEKTLGQLFCDHSSRAILDMLLAECGRGPGAFELVLNARGIAVASSGGFRVSSSAGELHAEVVVVATGGLSIPKMGATGLGYELARQFGLRVIEPRPALVPLVLGGEEKSWTELAGVSAEVVARAGGGKKGARGNPKFREKMLVTHRGLSGPAVLQASSYWRAGESLIVDFAPQTGNGRGVLGPLFEKAARRDEAAQRQALRAVLPGRMADHLAEAGAPGGWSNPALEQAERRLHAWGVHPVGTEGFENGEVTAGRVDTDDLNAQTMQARALPALSFLRAAVD